MMLLSTLIVSIGHASVSLLVVCCSGRTKISTSKIKFEHSDKTNNNSLDSDDIERISQSVIRRQSV